MGIDREGNEIALMDLLSCEEDEIFDSIDKKLQTKRLYEVIKSCLQERERVIIELRYGLLNGIERTQKEVGKMLGISRSYVSRIEKHALEKLQSAFDKPGM